MAKSRARKKSQEDKLQKRQALFLKIGWGIVVVICSLFGYTYGYPIAAQGDILKGILIGLAYGGGALGAILISFYLNRKLKGL